LGVWFGCFLVLLTNILVAIRGIITKERLDPRVIELSLTHALSFSISIYSFRGSFSRTILLSYLEILASLPLASCFLLLSLLFFIFYYYLSRSLPSASSSKSGESIVSLSDIGDEKLPSDVPLALIALQ